MRDQITGRTLGDFVVRDLLGEGGFGAVYRAEQPLLQREAVIKVVHHRLRASETIVQRFLREARLASHLDHPYAAHVYAFGAEPDGLLWIAMELVRGTPLDELLKTGGPLPLDRLVSLMARICEVVHTAHEQGIVHRDIKPANVIVLARAGRLLPKLLDFGIAKVALPAEGASRNSSPLLPMPAAANEVGLAETMTGDNTPPELTPTGGLDLTHRGAVVGSPRYMAPEQWVDASSADARADIYALAVLAYEALTGAPPFDGRTVHEVAVAHATGTVPSVAGRFPAALDAVFARGLAKSADDRYATALELAAAFREASGISEATAEVVPQLDEALRDALIADAPQPLAEAVAALAGTTSIRQARDAIRATVRVGVRLVGLIALACRTRLATRKGESDPVLGVLRDLRRRSLTDPEWLDLAREVCRPFASKPEAFPIPELVTLFFDGTAERDPLDESLVFTPQNERSGLSDDQVRELVQDMLPNLVRFLRQLVFLADYPLVVWRDRAERWMGLRRPRRAALQILGKALVPEQPVLVDRDGRPVLALWPLVQVVAPSPGVPDELFLFEGKGRHGARLIAMPLDFERQDETLWEWFGDHLLDTVDSDRSGELSEAPYRGLSAFTPDDAALFFGREREVEGFVNRLRMQPLVAVVGPSGAGKSSFVQAGVAPALPDRWCVITVRPGPSPLAALEARLAQAGLKAKLTGDPAKLGSALREFATAARTTIVLVVDQLEELFTLCLDPEERTAYAETLCQAARSIEDPIRVVLTLRDDFLVRAEQLAPLKTRLAQGLQLLATPAREDLLRIVVEPARRAGYDFEDRALPGQMVDAIADQPGALALLSFCAAKLWELRDRHFKQLGRRAYESMGGVGGALAQHAEAMLTALPLDEQRLVREAFRHLVTAEGTRATLTRPELLQVIGGGSRAEVVVERLIQARLVVASESATGDERIEVIHEALLGAWPRLVEWRREDADGARLRDQLRAAARQWHERGRPRGMLWRDETLAEYSIWRARHSSALTEIEAAFASASLGAAARARRARGLVIAGTIVALAIGLGVLYRSNQETQRQRAAAEEQGALARKSETEARENAALAKRRLVEHYVEQGRQATVAGDPRRALVFLEQAVGEGASGKPLELMLGWNAQRFAGHIAAYEHGGLTGPAIALSPDGRWVASTGKNLVVVWDASTGAKRYTLDDHTSDVAFVRFDTTGRRLATASRDKTVKIWDLSTGDLVHTLEQDSEVERIDLHEDKLVAVGSDGLAKLWDIGSGKLLTSFVGHTGHVARAAFDHTGERLATGGYDGTVRLWRVADGKSLGLLRAHEGRVSQVQFSPDGRHLASAGFDDARVRLWDVARRTRLHEVKHRAEVRTIGFDRGGRLVTGSVDRTAKVVALDGNELFTIETGSPVMFASFTPDGTRIVTACEDGSIRTWRADTAEPIWSFLGHEAAALDATFDATGSRLASASRDGTPRVWDIEYTGRLALVGHTGNVWSSAFSADGGRIATTASDGTAKLWDVGGKLLATIEAGTTEFGMAAFSPDGIDLAVAGPGGASVYEVAGSTTRRRFVLEGERRVTYLAYDPTGRLVTSSEHGSLRLWDARTGSSIRRLAGHDDQIWYVSFSADGKTIATASYDDTARTWDAATGNQRSVFGHPLDVSSAELSGDGKWLVTGGEDRLVRIWNVATGILDMALEGHTATVSTAAWSPDGKLVVTAGHDGTVRLWDLETRGQLATIDAQAAPFLSARFSGDGRTLVTTSGAGRVSLWSIPDRVSREEIEHLVQCRIPPRLRRSDTRPCRSPNAQLVQQRTR